MTPVPFAVPQAAGWAAWFLVAATAAAVATVWLIGWIVARGVLDLPNDRSIHTRATPRGGGIAIVAVTAWAAIVAAVIWPEARRPLAGSIVPALFIAAVSWLDDLRPLRNSVRFGVHLAAALVATALLGPVEAVDLGSLRGVSLGRAAWPLTILWLVGLTNAFNFMDGIDGIAGISAAVAGMTIAVAAGCLGHGAAAAVALAFAGGAIGFLTCNWPPARIFMGDVGSAFCGFSIAVMPLACGPAAATTLVPIAAVAMWPFIFDTAFTLCRRLSRHEDIFRPHRSHLYQRLVLAGWPHRATSAVYGGLSAVTAAVALSPFLGWASGRSASTLAAAVVAVGATLLVALVHLAERSAAPEPRPAASRAR